MSQNAVTRCVPYNNTCSDRYLPELFKRKREGRRKRERQWPFVCQRSKRDCKGIDGKGENESETVLSTFVCF